MPISVPPGAVHTKSGLMDLMDIARLTGHLPANRALIGIQPETMDWGMQPTDKRQASIAGGR